MDNEWLGGLDLTARAEALLSAQTRVSGVFHLIQ